MAVPHRAFHTDRPTQSGPGPYNSVAVGLHAGMAAIGYRESAGESHHHVNGSGGGGPATHRRATAVLRCPSLDYGRPHQIRPLT